MPLNLHTASAKEILDILNSPFMEISYSQEGEDRVLQRIFDGEKPAFPLMSEPIIHSDFQIPLSFI